MNRSTTTPFKKFLSSALLIAAAVLVTVSTPAVVTADRFDDQINALESEVGRFQAEAARLRSESDTLANRISVLNAQKQTIQAQIDLNQAKYDQLVSEIAKNEARLLKQQDFLGKTLASLYVESDVSDLEMLASSQSIGDFITKQEYRTAVRSQIQTSIKQVKDIKAQLDEQRISVERVLDDQKSQRETLAAQEAEQQRLLAETQGQEAAYQNLIADRNGQISGLRAEQLAANRSSLAGQVTAGDPGRGGYPSVWANAPMDSLVDNWGMYNRECVSYTAWKVYQSGRYMPYWGGRGNAKEWPSSAQADGIATGYTPKVGSVAISTAGYYGHSMYVEAVNDDGTIYVSQYNYGVRGEYSEMTISSSGLIYVYF